MSQIAVSAVESPPASTPVDAGNPGPAFFAGGGEMAGRMMAHDWSSTLGPAEQWPPALKILVSTMLGSCQPMFLAWGPQQIWLYNDAFIPILGLKHPLALGQPTQEVWSEARAELDPLFARVYAGDAIQMADIQLMLDRKGQPEEAHFSFSYTPARGEDGKVLGLFGTCQETTVQVLAQRSREQLQLRQQRIFQQAPGFIIIMRGPQHEVEFVNDAHRNLFGSERWVGQPIRQAFPSLIGQGFFEALDKVYETGEIYEASDAKVRYRKRPDASEEIRYLNFIYAPLVDDNGEISGVFCDGFDVTAAYKARNIQHELSESRAESGRQQRLYEAILTNTPDLAYVFDLQHRFIYANDILLKMWGVTREEAFGKTCLELGYEPWHAEMHSREIDRVVATRQPIRGEVPFAGTFGRRIYDYIFVPVLDADGNVEAVAGTTRDVTESKESEQKLRQLADELEETDRRKTEFLAMLAHELRNPLAPIANALGMIRHSGSKPELVAASTAIMQRQLQHMVRLVNDLMDISRISRGSISLQRERVNLAEVIAVALESSRPMIEAALQKLKVEIADEPMIVDADPVRLAQVICNLLNNASKYSKPGSAIELSAQRVDAQVRLVVRDNGIGIPADHLSGIFEMFKQLERGSESGRSGLGVGLALVKNLVELHGGVVMASSPGINQGSEFTVRLPLAQPLAAPDRSNDFGYVSVSGQRILVVDDNRDSAETLASILQLEGNTVRTVFSGEAAVETAQAFKPEIVLLDIGLPGIDGYEACRRIISQAESKPVLIATTGWGYDHDRQKSDQAGFDAHLVKPIDLPLLMETLGARCQQRNAAGQ